ncbi:hypothetical protein BDZ94DRAFT_1315704 [Collybia nuda]|uniref:Transposase n=1 Tax=Collybia nuda TaxID=64659 RepID=A0A9P5XUT9_9AGAR|nr:hypothetical protein BDZ94DRAFT_1315704 [Collybia nuda]
MEEWDIIILAYNCLKIPASIHGSLSAEKVPTATKVYPHLEHLQIEWEGLQYNVEYEPVHHALDAGLKNMKKWYRSTDKTSIYLITHVIDPTLKMEYIKAVWDEKSIDRGQKRLKKVFLEYKAKYDASKNNSFSQAP